MGILIGVFLAAVIVAVTMIAGLVYLSRREGGLFRVTEGDIRYKAGYRNQAGFDDLS